MGGGTQIRAGVYVRRQEPRGGDVLGQQQRGRQECFWAGRVDEGWTRVGMIEVEYGWG